MREKKRLEDALATDADLARRNDDIAAYLELAHEGEKVDSDLQREIGSLQQLVDRLETETLLSGENDSRNAIVTIHAGSGGVDSQDWADMADQLGNFGIVVGIALILAGVGFAILSAAVLRARGGAPA